MGTAASGPLGPAAAWASPTELLLRKWLFWAAMPITGVVIAVGAWAIIGSRGPSATSPEPAAAPESAMAGRDGVVSAAGSEQTPEESEAKEPPLAPGQFDGRWLPEETKLVVSLRLSQLTDREEFDPAVAAAQAVWAPSAGRLVETFGLRLSSVDRLCWASTDLSDWADSAVVVIELGEGQDTQAYRPIGEAVDIEFDGIACRRLTDSAWAHPYAVLDERTIVTGRTDLMRRLADRGEAGLASVLLDRFLREADSSSEILAAVDLTAARQAGWKLPTWWLDVWPATAAAWQVAWEMPCGLGLQLGGGDLGDGDQDVAQLALICDGPTAAEEVRQALDDLARAASDGIEVVTGSLSARVENGRMTAQAADRYETLLGETSAFLETARWTTIEETVWVRIEGEAKLWRLSARSLDSQAEIRTEWLDAARSADEANNRGPLSGLSAHERAEGSFPAGAGSETISATVLSPARDNLGILGKEGRRPKPFDPSVETGPPELEDTGAMPAGKPGQSDVTAQSDKTAQPLDVEARLSRTVVEIELPSVPLDDALELLAQLGGIKITLDTETMARLNVGRNDRVTFQRSASSLGEILEAILADRGLVYVIQNRQVLVTGPEEKRNSLYGRPYTVSDLTGKEPAGMAALASLVVQLVAPDSWEGSGGRGRIRLGQGVLEVVQTEGVHHELVAFCEKLRLARGLPFQSRGAPNRFTLTTHLGEAAKVLERPVALNFQQGAPLVRIVSDLEEAGRVDLLIDWLLLVDAGIRPETMGTLVVHQRPLAEALSQLLEPLGLAYRIIDSGTLEITTRKAAAARLELEFFDVGSLIATGIPAQSLVEPIKDRLAQATWNDAGGPAVIHFDQPSQHLIVLQSQQVQVEIELLLRALAEVKR